MYIVFSELKPETHIFFGLSRFMINDWLDFHMVKKCEYVLNVVLELDFKLSVVFLFVFRFLIWFCIVESISPMRN